LAAIQHKLSWSASRAKNFRSCKRRYYYDYYGSWLGWDSSAEDARRHAYRLKNMSRIPMLAGTIVHDSIQRWLLSKASGQLEHPEMLKSAALDQLRGFYKASRTALTNGSFARASKRDPRLAEHYYGESVVDEASGEAAAYGGRYIQTIETCLSNFFEMPELARVRDCEPDDQLSIEEMGTFLLLDTEVFAIPDFAMVEMGADGMPKCWIYDWKTGSPRKSDAQQLSVYVLYAMETWGVAPEDVTCVLAYLGEGRLDEHRFSGAEIEALAQRMAASIEEMAALHFDAGLSLGDPADFPMVDADEAGLKVCAGCGYRELCGRAG
jgi:hypothetical protein